MRVLLVSTAYPPSIGGAQLHAHELARALRRGHHDVHVAAVWRTSRTDWLRGTTVRARLGPGDPEEVDGVPVHPIGVRSRVGGARVLATFYPALLTGVGDAAMRRAATELFVPGLDEVVRRVQPDVVHATRVGRAHPYAAALAVARATDRPFLLTPNHHEAWDRRRDAWWWDLYREADAVLALSDAEAEILVTGGVSPARVHRTTVGVVGTPVEGVEERGPVVAFVGQAHAYKGLDLLAAAWPSVSGAVPGARLEVVGPWHRGQRRLRAQLAATPGVTVHGAVDEATKWQLLSTSAVLAVPSSAESLGGVYLEAWAAGAVPVGADIPPVRELLAGAGEVVPREPAALAETLVALLQDRDVRHAAVSEGRRRLAETHDWDRIANRVVDVYRRVGAT